MADNTDNTDLTIRQTSRQASVWLVRLQDAPEDAELRREFEDWLADPANAAAWQETQRMLHAVAGATPSHAERWSPFLRQVRAQAEHRSASTADRSRPAPPNTGRRIADGVQDRRPVHRMNRRRALRLTGLAAAAALVAIVAGPELALRVQADYATATAETQTVRLADDSLVTVAPASAIAVAYTAGERHVRLLAGEVYLDVTPDAARPLRVTAGGVRVTVLGTGFNVSRSDDQTVVGVAHGAVRVEQGNGVRPDAETLRAGEFVRVNGSERVQRGEQPASQIGAWRQNQLIVQDQPLRYVLDRLRRYHSGAIVVTDDALADQPVTGVYDLGNPVGALRGIARSQNAVVREITPWLLVVSRR